MQLLLSSFLAGGSTRKQRAVRWMSHSLHRRMVTCGQIRIASFLDLWSYGEFLFLTMGRRYSQSQNVRSTNSALTCAWEYATQFRNQVA